MPTPDSLNHAAQFAQVPIHRGCSAPIPLCHTWDDRTASMQTRADLHCQKEVFVSAVCPWGVDRQSGKKLDGEEAH